MTKLVPLTCLCILLLCTVVSAQSPAGSIFISSGIGIIPSYTGKATQTEFPAVSFEAGYRISNAFSLNAYVGYTEASTEPKVLSDGIESSVHNKTTMFGLKGQLHKNFTDKVEMYGGIILGFSTFDRTETDLKTGEKIVRTTDEPSPYNPNEPGARLLYSGFIGGKYWLNPRIGVYSEMGLSVSLLTAGISVRI
ncbi:MAG: hypothetical protein AAFZ15_25870 [Bacteroidota bacterium]